MRAIIQRVSKASVEVDKKTVGEISHGYMILAGFSRSDDETKIAPMIEKIIHMRIFSNEKGRFDYSILDVKGSVLLIPQFTLFADTNKGRRPEFFEAMEHQKAKEFFLKFTEEFKKTPIPVARGEFGADMKVSLINDGPVTITLEV